MATRLRLPSAGNPAVSPSLQSYTHLGGQVRRPLPLTDNSPLTTVPQNPDGGNHFVAGDTLHVQFVSEPMAAGVVFSTADTVTYLIQGLEPVDSDGAVQVFVRVVSQDGLTQRAVLRTKVADFSDLGSFLIGRRDSRNLTGAYTTVAGDRLVVEFSVTSTPTVGGHNASLRWGSDGTGGDIVNDGQTATTLNPWIEFSNDIIFASPGTRRGLVSWAELEVPEPPRRAIISFAEMETLEAARLAVISWAEMETPADQPRRALVSWAELEVTEGTPARLSFLFHRTWSWTKFRRNTKRRAIVSFAEFETTFTARRAIVSFAELEVITTRRAVVSWAEMETPVSISPSAGSLAMTNGIFPGLRPSPTSVSNVAGYRDHFKSGGGWPFEAWLGAPVQQVIEFVTFNGPNNDTTMNWNAMANPGHLYGWRHWVAQRPTERTVHIALPVGVTHRNTPGGTNVTPTNLVELIADAPDDRYDKYYRTLADNLMNNGLGTAWIRVGWEHDGSWYPWKSRPSFPANAAHFALAARRIIDVMRARQPSNQWKFGISPTVEGGGHGSSWLEQVYPGDAHCEFVGVDFYDQSWLFGTNVDYVNNSMSESTKNSRRQQVWNNLLGKFNVIKAHAQAHGKPMCFPEWGLVDRVDTVDGVSAQHGGLDNVLFIQNMHALIHDPANNFIGQMYLDGNPGSHKIKISRAPVAPPTINYPDTVFPNGSASYKTLFGSVASGDIETKADADLLNNQHSGVSWQAMGSSGPLSSLSESGITGPALSNGETLRLGKISDPLGGVFKVFQCQVGAADPSTSGGKRVELLSSPANVVFNQVYWIIVDVFVYDWGNLQSNDSSLFGCQMHTGSAETVGGPSFQLATFGTGHRNFRPRLRWSPGPSGQFNQNATVINFSDRPIPFGQWTEFIFKFKHNTSGSGLFQLWMNGTQLVNYAGSLGYNTGFDDYAKFGYYNFGTMNNTPRKVLIRSPHVVHDPTGNTYVMNNIRNLIT